MVIFPCWQQRDQEVIYRSALTPDFATTAVWKGPYEFAVIERRIVECASSTEIRCQVRSRGDTTILDVVPEGSFVQVGDTVVELDDSNLLLEENDQKILIATRESQLSQAENTLLAAKIAKTEYLKGLYASQEKELSLALFVAERGKATAEAALKSAKALNRKGIFTALQLEAAHLKPGGGD